MRSWIAAGFAALVLALPAAAQTQKPETAKVRLAVGGKSSLYYLPLTITERLGYFKEAGLDVEISDFAGGAKSLQALIGGSADVVTGSFDHTIQMQAKNQSIVAVVQMGRFPGFALGLRKEKAANYTGPKDLKGMKIGVTAPGSSTHFMVLYMMAQAGLKPDDAVFIGTGSGGTVVAAVQHGEVDGVSNADPMITKLDREGAIRIVADTRTLEGTTKVYGGPYPAATLYAQSAFIERNPNTVQALVTALVRGLKWVQAHSADDIAKMMPEEYMLGDKPLFVEAIKANHAAYSPDGRFMKDGPETALKVLKAFDPNVANAKIDLAKAYSDRFVEKANAGH
ncbi:MAG: sulfonate transport system substrate-binding protein [Hyphomicrobiales bacterium]|jgi:NitT/TauT family transport system substrate-binding protein|nr:sulfonate transport system substrate-binding protein [Hyphomicrobiales bacterium]